MKSKAPRLWSGLPQGATGLDIGAAAFVTHDRDFSHVTGVEILTGESGSAA